MNRKLTSEQIEATCRQLLSGRRPVTVRTVMAELRRRNGSAGRTERVSGILRRLQTAPEIESTGNAPAADVVALRERLEAAEARAARSEEMERRHQDYWAKRYAEKADELERRYAAAIKARPAITTDQYLRLQQRIADLARRLSQYEPVGP
jgi:hypothetical protein